MNQLSFPIIISVLVLSSSPARGYEYCNEYRNKQDYAGFNACSSRNDAENRERNRHSRLDSEKESERVRKLYGIKTFEEAVDDVYKERAQQQAAKQHHKMQYEESGAIKVKSIAQVEVELVKDGKRTLHREPVEKAVPGTEIIFTNTFENVTGKEASDIEINNPIPDSSTYKAGSAFGADCEILFSVDDGKNFSAAESLKIIGDDGEERVALPAEYTNIRWIYKKQLPSGKASEVGFRSTIN